MKLFLKYRYAAIVLAVLLPRLLWFVFLGGNIPEPARDQGLYLSLAGRVAEGEGISFSSETGFLRSRIPAAPEFNGNWKQDPDYVFGMVPVETPTASIEPGYPVILALIFMLTGPSTGGVYFLNSIFALLGAFSLFVMVRENWGEKQALLAALIWSVYPYYVYYSAYAMTDMIHISLLPVIALLTMRSVSKVRAGFAAGISTGMLFLARSTAIFLLPVQIIWLFIRKRWKAALAVLFGFILCCVPWVVRNQRAFGSPVLMPTKGSLNLWMRNSPSLLAIEGIHIPDFIGNGIKRRELLEYPSMEGLDTELERSHLIMTRAVQFIVSNPGLFAYLAVVRACHFLSPIGGTVNNAAAKLTGILIYFPMLLIAMREAFRRRRDSRIIYLGCIFLLYLGLHALAHGGVRYRLPVDMILMTLSSLFVGRKMGWSEMETDGGITKEQ